MVNEQRSSSACRCRYTKHFGSYIGLFCMSALIFAYANAQEAQVARFESPPGEEEGKSQSPVLYRDEGYFWEQAKLYSERTEQPYDETVDAVQEGMANERQGRQRLDVAGYESESEWNPDAPVDKQISARHETLGDEDIVPIADVPAGNGRPCSRGKVCAIRDESRSLMIENLKRNILTQLKMSEPPNITVPQISLDSPPLRRLFKKYGIKPDSEEPEPEVEEDPDWVEDESSKEKVISYARTPPFAGQSGSYFKFSEEVLIHTVVSAEIWFYIRSNPTGSARMTLDFYRYQVNETHPDAPHVAVKFNRKVITIGRKSHWRSFSIPVEVSRWFLEPSSNLGIDIRSPDFPDLVIFRPLEGHDDRKPMLEVDLEKNDYSRRRKRDIGSLTCNEHSQEPRCCKYNLRIDFRSMGWNWIINPSTYRSYYCSGDCPLLFLQNNHNKVMAMQSQGSTPKASAPCCGPTKMSSISMLYFDNQQNIIYGEVSDMVVDRCGCK